MFIYSVFSFSSFKELDADFIQAECIGNWMQLVLNKIELGNKILEIMAVIPVFLSFEAFSW